MTWAGIAVSAALLWGVVFSFAYSRRQFGGTARGYTTAGFITWLATMAIFMLMSLAEQ